MRRSARIASPFYYSLDGIARAAALGESKEVYRQHGCIWGKFARVAGGQVLAACCDRSRGAEIVDAGRQPNITALHESDGGGGDGVNQGAAVLLSTLMGSRGAWE